MMKQPIFEGSITKVHGIRVGHAQNKAALTGVTVVLASHDGAVVAADVRGAAPGTRETDLCKPENTVEKANAVVLSGGSAYGLAAATGVMEYLEKCDVGMDMGICRVPIVPAAVLYDLAVGDAHVRPDAKMGIEACKAAGKEVLQGAVGAGTGATVGKLVPGAIPMQSGVGTASLTLACGVTIGAIAAVNACGDVYDLRNGKPLACGHLPGGKPVLCEGLLYGEVPLPDTLKISSTTGQNTTIAVIATDAVLTKAQAQRLATCAHDGLARTIRPVHTQMDGDTVFALATGRVEADVNPIQLCAAAAEVMARAICNAVVMGQKE
ncbi:MAG: P1 family peptidase [Clostridia bacterium]